MSYIRFSSQRRFSEGERMYAFPSNGCIRIMGEASVKNEDWKEVTMRILERQDASKEAKEEALEALESEFNLQTEN